jgi:hypothetical protein
VITTAERDFLAGLHRLVPTPRLAKRLVNVFRLIKAGVPADELPEFEDPEHGRHRAVLLLLAILYGRSELAPELFRRLCAGANGDWPDATPLHEALRQAAREGEEEPEEQKERTRRTARDPDTAGEPPAPPRPNAGRTAGWTELADRIEEAAPDVPVAACRREAPRAARYSLVTGQEWHTWGAAAGDPTPPADPA